MVEAGLLAEVRRWTPRACARAGPPHGRWATSSSCGCSTAHPPWRRASEETIVATRQFARRQLTWFRADPRIGWLDWQRPDLLAAAVAPYQRRPHRLPRAPWRSAWSMTTHSQAASAALSVPRRRPRGITRGTGDALLSLQGLAFSKGHGTGQRLCPGRRSRTGSASIPGAGGGAVRPTPGNWRRRTDPCRPVPAAARGRGRCWRPTPAAEWFMDYRNGDGSLSEMCGNGVRVFVHFLIAQGLISLAPGEALTIGTRGGVKKVVRTADGYAVDMGPWEFIFPGEARTRGMDSLVSAAGLEVARPALSVSMGNPHTVVALAAQGGTGCHGAVHSTRRRARPAERDQRGIRRARGAAGARRRGTDHHAGARARRGGDTILRDRRLRRRRRQPASGPGNGAPDAWQRAGARRRRGRAVLPGRGRAANTWNSAARR